MAVPPRRCRSRRPGRCDVAGRLLPRGPGGGGLGARPGAPQESDPQRAPAGRQPGLHRRLLPDAGRRVPGRRPGDRLRRRHHGPVHLRHHGADPGQGGDGARSAARPAAVGAAGRRAVLPPGPGPAAAGRGAAAGRAGPLRQHGVDRAAAVHRLPVSLRADLGAAPGRDGGRPAAGPPPDLMASGSMVPESYYLVLSALLFAIGAIGVVVRRNPLVIFMSIELMLNAVNLSFVAFGRRLGNNDGQALVLFVMAVAAAEVAVGLAIIVAIFRLRRRLSIDDLSLMKW